MTLSLISPGLNSTYAKHSVDHIFTFWLDNSRINVDVKMNPNLLFSQMSIDICSFCTFDLLILLRCPAPSTPLSGSSWPPSTPPTTASRLSRPRMSKSEYQLRERLESD